jgi:hypothetical protein
MYYTQIIIEDHAEATVNDNFVSVLAERWKFIEDGNGRSKYIKADPEFSWALNPSFNTVDNQESKENYDAWGAVYFGPSVIYYGMIKVWNTESAAQGWVDAVQALDLPGVTISYHGTTDPSI